MYLAVSCKVLINGIYALEEIGYLAYDKELAKENNYVENHHLFSADYIKLVEIIEKYNIVQYLLSRLSV